MNILNRKPVIILLVLLVAVLVAGYIKIYTPAAPINPLADVIRVDVPSAGSKIVSPVSVAGIARGPWYFEASFPVRIYDANGNLLGSAPVQAQGDWMTSEFVPFAGKISFSKSSTSTGTIVFVKDNPSGLPQNDAQLVVPVKF